MRNNKNTLEKILDNLFFITTINNEKILCNKTLFHSLIKGEATFEEIKSELMFDLLVRNKESIFYNNTIIDSGSLWLKKGDYCYLYDRDLPIKYLYDDKIFIETKYI